MSNEQQLRYNDELRLCEHLFRTVRNSLTGERLPEVLDARPVDVLHAGVLLPRSQHFAAEIADSSTSGLTDPAEAGTASLMGIDFQWQGEGTLSLLVIPRISVYYPVFPTYDEVCALADSSDSEPDDTASEIPHGAEVDSQAVIVE